MEGQRLIHKLRLENLLSFGPEGMEIELEPLNVLIGPNASGKSNLIDAISLLHAAPTDLTKPMRGDTPEWYWRGHGGSEAASVHAWLEAARGRREAIHNLRVGVAAGRARVVAESVLESPGEDRIPGATYYGMDVSGRPAATIWRSVPTNETSIGAQLLGPTMLEIDLADLKLDQSILSQRRDPGQYPELTYIGEQYARIAIYREWHVGRNAPPAPPRLPQATDESAVYLEPDARNLGLVLNNLEGTLGPRSPVLRWLKRVHPGAEGLSFPIFGGTVRMMLHERGLDIPIPATRLSDGTMRWLCLLAVLCHPEPPPLVCLEEPEMGLHPDALGALAELLVDASQRMQLIVTTHSSELVSALSETPEAVVVCKRDASGTRMERLDSERLEKWLDDYALGDLWAMGEIGGTLR